MRPMAFWLFVLATLSYSSYQTQVFHLRTADDFMEGVGSHVAYLREGGIAFAPQLHKLLDSPEALLWTAARDAKGKMYLGTGQRGVLLVLNSSFRVEHQIVLPEVNITTLLPTASGVLAAGFPSGGIYRILESGGEEPAAKLPVKYIWKLIQDPKTDALYAITGEPACLYQVLPKQKAIYCAQATHFLTGALVENNFYLGSSNPPSLYRITKHGKASVLQTFEGEDLYALVANGSRLYVAVNPQQALSSKPKSEDPKNGGRLILGEKAEQPSYSKTIFPAPEQKSALSAKVYEVQVGHLPKLLLDVGDPVITSLSLYQKMLFVGTGNEGRVYRYPLHGDGTSVFELPSRQILSFVLSGDTLYLAGGNPAALYALSLTKNAQKLTYRSNILEAQVAALPGEASLRGDLPAALTVRAGNTPAPDDTWTEWLPAKKLPRTPFRYYQIQVQAASKKAAHLSELLLSVRPLNRPPQILSLDLQAPKSPKTLPSQNSTEEDPLPRTSIRRLMIKTQDPDGDSLRFDIFLEKDSGESILLEKGWSKPFYDFNFKDFPEGLYRLRVVASDRLDNTPEDAATDSLSTPYFFVDLTPPKIEVDFDASFLRITVRENLSSVNSCTLVMGRHILPLLPEDGVLDQKVEHFRIKKSDLRFPLLIKAEDESSNAAIIWVQNEKN